MLPANPSTPTVEDITRIKNLKDPVIRNLQITQCYSELSAVLAGRTGPEANWCTFATWASKQAGQTIRKEDLVRLFERLLRRAPSMLRASETVAAALPARAGNQFLHQPEIALTASNFISAIARAGDAVARGNQKVFEEIGYEFARFYQTCPFDQPLDHEKISRFCNELRPGAPPDGQDYLRQAFTHYAQALAEKNPKARAELVLLANIEIGFHEQTRLQPEIAESLDAPLMSFLDFARPLFRVIFPLNGWLHLAHLYLRRLLGHPTPLDAAIQALLGEAKILLHQAITEIMMTISLPSGVVLRLDLDLNLDFPEPLRQIANPELSRFLETHDPSPDNPDSSGALDWADLPDRLHLIIDFFRCCQEQPDLFEPPFKPDQVAALKDGRLPEGRL